MRRESERFAHNYSFARQMGRNWAGSRVFAIEPGVATSAELANATKQPEEGLFGELPAAVDHSRSSAM